MRLSSVISLLFIVTAAFTPVYGQEGPTKLQLDEADYYLRQFEEYVSGLKGREGSLDPGRRALEKVSTLKKDFPDHPQVLPLIERAQNAARALRGDRIEVTEEMLAYRKGEDVRSDLLAKYTRKAWRNLQLELLNGDSPVLTEPLPAPNPEETSLDEIKGTTVVLEGLQYPDGVFLHYGKPYVAIGSPATGFYFINTGAQRFVGAYEAVRRFQRLVSGDTPAEWTVVGEISSAQYIVPGGGKSGEAYAGWILDVHSIYVPDMVLGRFDAENDLGGSFAGESEMDELLGDTYTVTEVPEGASPEQLMETFVAAIKQKNFELFKECIHPDEQLTAVQKNWIERKWDIFQRRFKNDIVHVAIGEKEEIETVQGGGTNEDVDLLADILDEEEVKDITDDGKSRIEDIVLWLKVYDETGRIQESLKAVTLRREEDLNNNRWYVYRGFPF